MRSAPGPEGVIIRTLDIGGDKLHSLHDSVNETNPVLGWRGIRVSLKRRKLFKSQLRAILRASAYGSGPAAAEHPRSLAAAEATLVASRARGMFGGRLPW